jgi:hypothetical protein
VNTQPLPAERLATLLFWLGKALVNRNLAGTLAGPLFILIMGRLKAIRYAFARLATRIEAGKFAPRRSSPRQPATEKKPRRRTPLPQGFAWLIKMVPETTASASQLQILLADADMAALLNAAAAQMRRPLRSLCQMLGVILPPILAPLPDPRPKKPPVERKPRPKREKLPRVRYVFGIRYPSIFPNPR